MGLLFLPILEAEILKKTVSFLEKLKPRKIASESI
jgi:hypothetical protein